MTLELTGSQQVTSSEGWQVESAGREAVLYRQGGREAVVGVDRGRPTRLYVDDLAWIARDGNRTALTAAEADLVLRRLVAGLERMGLELELFTTQE